MATYKPTLEKVRYSCTRLDPETNQYQKLWRSWVRDIYSWYRARGIKYREKLPKGVSLLRINDAPHAAAHQDWREHKRIRRDKGKRKRHNKWKKYAKHFSNRQYRAHERQLIGQERFDDLWSYKRKDYWDPWSWD